MKRLLTIAARAIWVTVGWGLPHQSSFGVRCTPCLILGLMVVLAAFNKTMADQKVKFEKLDKPRVIVLTDITNEPDDEESMVRFLVYANEFDVEGLIATTSVWLRDKVRPENIRERIEAYGKLRSSGGKQDCKNTRYSRSQR